MGLNNILQREFPAYFFQQNYTDLLRHHDIPQGADPAVLYMGHVVSSLATESPTHTARMCADILCHDKGSVFYQAYQNCYDDYLESVNDMIADPSDDVEDHYIKERLSVTMAFSKNTSTNVAAIMDMARDFEVLHKPIAYLLAR